VEACELIPRQLSHVSRERGHCAGVAGFELGKRLQITCIEGPSYCSGPERLESTERFGLTAQDQVADRTFVEIFHFASERTELLPE